MIRFGPWSTTLGLGMLFAFAVAAALVARPGQRSANRWVAALLAVMALKISPYAIGYAGFYDAYPWLSFAPLSHELAFGPLLWLHVQQRTRDELPPRWGWHLLAPGLVLVYLAACFVQPLNWKNDWNSRVHAPFVDPALTWLGLLSLGCYLALAWRRQTQYQAWLVQHISNAAEHRFTALRNLLLGLGAWVLLSVPYEIATAAWQLDYYDRFALYLALTGLVFALGLEAWRHMEPRHPRQPWAEPETGVPQEPLARSAPDWPAMGQAWRERTVAAGWWREPELSLESLARRLGTNTTYLSRAFNEGLGQNFSEVIGGMRVDWVCRRLKQSDAIELDLLALGLEAGFASKTSFNRVFKAHTGLTPSAWRRAKS